jgi:transposase InsO family protein
MTRARLAKAGPRPTPKQRTRPTWDDKRAAVVMLLRVAADGRPDPTHIRQVAERYGVARQTVYKWLADPSLRCGQRAESKRRVYTPTDDHITLVGHEQNFRSAFTTLKAKGDITCGYSTFARAIRLRYDAALLASSLDGHRGLLNNRVGLRFTAPHRMHTLHTDSTKGDIWVRHPDHRVKTPIRPWITVAVCSSTGMITALTAWAHSPNTETMMATFVESAAGSWYGDTFVGGLPAQIVFDNGAENLAATREAALRLGVLIAPTAPHSPNQNGKAERVFGLLNQFLLHKLPGTNRGGTNRNRTPRFVAKLAKDIKPDEVLAWDAFLLLLEAFKVHLNTKVPMKEKHGGLTRLQAWEVDQTDLRFIEPEILRTEMLPSAKLHVVGGDGLHHRSTIYVASELVDKRGDWMEIRYLPTNRDFIEVFDANGNYVCQAVDQDLLKPETKKQFDAARARQSKKAAAISAGIKKHRKHMAASMNEQYGTEQTEYTANDVVDALTAADGEESGSADSDTVATDEDNTLDTQAFSVPALPKLPRAKTSSDTASKRAKQSAQHDAFDTVADRMGLDVAQLPGIAPLTPTTTAAAAPNPQPTSKDSL